MVDHFSISSDRIFAMKEGTQKDREILESINKMHAYANEKHDHYLKIWAEFDSVEFAVGFMVGAFLILYYFVTAFDKSE